MLHYFLVVVIIGLTYIGKSNISTLFTGNYFQLSFNENVFNINVHEKKNKDMNKFFTVKDQKGNIEWNNAKLTQIQIFRSTIINKFGTSNETNIVSNEHALWMDFAIGNHTYELEPVESTSDYENIISPLLKHRLTSRYKTESFTLEDQSNDQNAISLNDIKEKSNNEIRPMTAYNPYLEIVSSSSFLEVWESNWAGKLVNYFEGGSNNVYNQYAEENIYWQDRRYFTFLDGYGPIGENVFYINQTFVNWISTLSEFIPEPYWHRIYGIAKWYGEFHSVTCQTHGFCGENSYENHQPVIALTGITLDSPYDSDDAIRYTFTHELGHLLNDDHNDGTSNSETCYYFIWYYPCPWCRPILIPVPVSTTRLFPCENSTQNLFMIISL